VSHITGKFDRLIFLADIELQPTQADDELVFIVDRQSCKFMFSTATEQQQWKKEIQYWRTQAQQQDEV